MAVETHRPHVRKVAATCLLHADRSPRAPAGKLSTSTFDVHLSPALRLLFSLFHQAYQARSAKSPGIHFFPTLHSAFGNSEFVIPPRTRRQALVQLPTSLRSTGPHLRIPLLLRRIRRDIQRSPARMNRLNPALALTSARSSRRRVLPHAPHLRPSVSRPRRRGVNLGHPDVPLLILSNPEAAHRIVRSEEIPAVLRGIDPYL